MTRVHGLGGLAPPARRIRAGQGFALPGAAPDAAQGLAASAGIGAVLAMQAQAGNGRDAAERLARRAGQALDELRGLQLDLLRGGADPARLARLAALAEGPEAVADPALRDVAQAVALRVRVELARRRAGNTGATASGP